MSDRADGGHGLFRGKGIAWSGEAEISIAQLAAACRAGRWGKMPPFVMMLVGCEGTLIFGWIVLATGLYGLWLMGSSLRKGS